MTSMIVLFLNFFIRRYIFQKGTASMSGVIKSMDMSSSQLYAGMVTCDADGRAVVVVPRSIVPSPQGRYEILILILKYFGSEDLFL